MIATRVYPPSDPTSPSEPIKVMFHGPFTEAINWYLFAGGLAPISYSGFNSSMVPAVSMERSDMKRLLKKVEEFDREGAVNGRVKSFLPLPKYDPNMLWEETAPISYWNWVASLGSSNTQIPRYLTDAIDQIYKALHAPH